MNTREPLAVGVLVHERYEVVRALGDGDLSRLYLVRDALDPRQSRCVLREFCPLSSTDSDADRRRAGEAFEREMARAQTFRQKNLPRYAEWFAWDGGHYAVREFVDEHNLAEVLGHMPGLPPEHQVRVWIGQLCEAFSYLHAQSPPFLVQSLKPENIAISTLGKVRMLDYSVHSLLPDDLAARFARRAAAGFSSPEQGRGEACTCRSDVYTLGALYYFMLTRLHPREVPYQRENVARLRADLGPGALDVLDRALAVAPQSRFSSVAELKVAVSEGIATVRHEVMPFDLDTRDIRIEARPGEVVRSRIRLVGRLGEVYGRLRSDRPWLRFKFDVFRGKFVDLDFSVDTYEMAPGCTHLATVQIDTEFGLVEVPVRVHVEAPLGARLAGFLRGFFSPRNKPDGEEDF